MSLKHDNYNIYIYNIVYNFHCIILNNKTKKMYCSKNSNSRLGGLTGVHGRRGPKCEWS